MVRVFVLGVALLALVGICTVRETNKQIQARYELERLTRGADEAEKRLARLRADEQSLRAPSNLAKIVREKGMNLYALAHTLPAAATPGRKARRPGEVLDDIDNEAADTMELASAGARQRTR